MKKLITTGFMRQKFVKTVEFFSTSIFYLSKEYDDSDDNNLFCISSKQSSNAP